MTALGEGLVDWLCEMKVIDFFLTALFSKSIIHSSRSIQRQDIYPSDQSMFSKHAAD